ncbi:MAG TPA: winged helix-turn-helix domain-containing protein [Nitrososphaerales archaeon]|nr:winged helix-turn-helix domain-containing protein [Nitrososphaerales archaeon]
MRDNPRNQDKFGGRITGAGSEELSDSDIILSMLYYCKDTPKLQSQIMSYCGLSSGEFRRFVWHCVGRKLLRVSINRGAGIEQYELTDKGAKLLNTVNELREGLGIGSIDSIIQKNDDFSE